MEGSSMDTKKEQQFIRLNKDIDILMTAGSYDEAVEKIDKALPLTKEIANKTILDKLQSDLPKAEFVFLDQLYPTFEINKKLQC